MRVAVIGGVASTAVLLEKLSEHGFRDVRVWGYEPVHVAGVSGWSDLAALSSHYDFLYQGFRKVTACEDELVAWSPDVLFVVGLSQIVPASMLSVARLGSIGFHPTALPKGRGRAAIAWLLLEQQDGAATFFELAEGVDDGPIHVQVPFAVTKDDDATSVERKLLEAERVALDMLLPKLQRIQLNPMPQDHASATWYGRRTSDDGLIDWSQSGRKVCALIRAAAPPHPGAFTFAGDVQIRVLSAEMSDRPEVGVVGRILKVFDDRAFEVQTGQGLIKVMSWEATGWHPRVGVLLGYYEQLEIFQLRARVANLECRLSELEAAISGGASGAKNG